MSHFISLYHEYLKCCYDMHSVISMLVVDFSNGVDIGLNIDGDFDSGE